MDCENPVNRYTYLKAVWREANRSPMMSNSIFLAMAVLEIFRSVTILFGYRSDAAFYNLTLFKWENNWWQLTDLIRLWGGIALYSIFAISQGLSMAGLLPDINFNILIWTGLAIASLHLLEMSLSWYTYNMLDNKSTNLKVSNFYRSQSKAALPELEEDRRIEKLVKVSELVMIFIHGENWFWSQFYELPIESQDKWIEYWEERAEKLAAEYSPIMPRIPAPEEDIPEEDEEAEDDSADEVPTSSEKKSDEISIEAEFDDEWASTEDAAL